jgi:hemolysin activation/secretion protein
MRLAKRRTTGRARGLPFAGWVLGVGLAHAALAADPMTTPPAGGIGQELKAVENAASHPPTPGKQPKAMPSLPVPAATNGAPAATTKPPAPGEGHPLIRLVIAGDRDAVVAAGMEAALRRDVENRRLTDRDIQRLAASCQARLVSNGYYVATVWPQPTDYADGVLTLNVDKGRFGEKKFYAKSGEPSWLVRCLRWCRLMRKPAAQRADAKKEEFRGRHFSRRQIEQRFAGLRKNDPFLYPRLHGTLYQVNSHPDVTVDTDLRLRKEGAGAQSRRFVDMDFFVEENLPLHAIVGISSTGTRPNEDWLRPSLSLQHLNLTRHDDVLTVNLGPFSLPKVEALTSGAGSYHLPHHVWKGGGTTLYGGYADRDAEEVVKGVDIRGYGWFLGLQESLRLLDSERHALSAGLSVAYREVEDQIVLTGEGEDGQQEETPTEKRTLTFIPLGLSFNYSTPFFSSGRMFLTSSTSLHFEGMDNADAAEFERLRIGADATYAVERLQLALLQPVRFGRRPARAASGAPTGDSLVFAKVDGQFGSGTLIPAEQKPLGGMDSVRGFPERVVLGDDGVSGTVEFRTPFAFPVTRALARFRDRTPEARRLRLQDTEERLQGVVFVDGGYVANRESLGEQDSYTLWSAGLGFRYGYGPALQVRFDWGFPLGGQEDVSSEETGEVDASGRFHFSLSAQF